MDESDDDVTVLSAEAAAALREFYMEQEIMRNSYCDLEESVVEESSPFKEDWQLSQFWYDDKTVKTICDEICRVCPAGSKVALISAPTLYKSLKKMSENSIEVKLFEYDSRFSAYGSDFHFYDYKSPLDLPTNFSAYFDLVVADPPFLSEECLTKTAVTIKFLAKSKIILCTGEIMEDLAKRLLQVKKTPFSPEHRHKLGNTFACFTNYNDKFVEYE
ncbi:EEF1A lysine methyltransferase 1 [Cimex lectularius]|uniref:Protein-lysine N-methyltransferase 106663964 n=1 Tax=Cimex lectularius TaxID=79782 RepID=A0A8I6SH56_CIMLE|nr:EEF1A lysine methyltransferase 1 [Cimex lectularius]XP_024083213.1 EEF1A lysine methyltransferase 1 [Cimex lectularius]